MKPFPQSIYHQMNEAQGRKQVEKSGGPLSKKSGRATYKAEKGGCVIYYISVKKLGGPWPPRPPQCLRP